MQVIPDAVSSAYNDTEAQPLTAEGLFHALDEIVAESEALNIPNPRSTAIIVLVDVLKLQMGKVRECHEAEWRAWHAPKLKVAE